MLSDQELKFLEELGRQKVQFMIVGLAAAAMQGAPVVTQDLGLWFKDLADSGIRKALRKVGGAYVPPIGLHPPVFAGKAVKLFDVVIHMHGLEEFEKEAQTSLWISLGRFKVRVLPLERIIESKKATGREKDKLVLSVLADALVAIRERTRGRRAQGKKRRDQR
jgi:hypothetical protein